MCLHRERVGASLRGRVKVQFWLCLLVFPYLAGGKLGNKRLRGDLEKELADTVFVLISIITAVFFWQQKRADRQSICLRSSPPSWQKDSVGVARLFTDEDLAATYTKPFSGTVFLCLRRSRPSRLRVTGLLCQYLQALMLLAYCFCPFR